MRDKIFSIAVALIAIIVIGIIIASGYLLYLIASFLVFLTCMLSFM